jgi:CrcB protein
MKEMLGRALAIGGAGFLGSLARWLIAVGVGKFLGRWNVSFPFGTLIINVSGSFFLGWFLTMAAGRLSMSETTRFAIATGFVGAYTTFSTYMWESNSLFQRGAHYQAWANLFGSLVLGMIAVYLGTKLAQ